METVGSLIDKLCINELKIYHMAEQAERDDTDDDFMNDVLSGKRRLRIYRQMKMYNEKKFKD